MVAFPFLYDKNKIIVKKFIARELISDKNETFTI